MGLLDGEVEGIGLDVGDREGRWLGEKEGRSVGEREGESEGRSVGDTDGIKLNEGASEGITVDVGN